MMAAMWQGGIKPSDREADIGECESQLMMRLDMCDIVCTPASNNT